MIDPSYRVQAPLGIDPSPRSDVARPDLDGSRRSPQTVNSTSLTDEIVWRLESAILDGEYTPGTRLRQDELCERFGVSRTPVREALRDLRARNLVVLSPNRGATVRTPVRQDTVDLYDVLAELDGYACQLALETGRDELVPALHAAQNSIDACVRDVSEHGAAGTLREPHVRLDEANVQFHDVILAAAGNQVLASSIRELADRFPVSYLSRLETSTNAVQAINVDEHHEIMTAFGRGDAVGARDAMRRHILHIGSVVLFSLDARGFWTPAGH